MRPFGFPVVVHAPDSGGNTAPQFAAALSVGMDEDATALTVDLLAGASDDENDPLAVSGFAQTAGRTATITRSGATLTLDPAQFNDLAAGQSATLTFAYDVTDGTDAVAQTLTITVTGANDAPTVAAPLTATADEDAAPVSIGLLAGASDVDTGDTLSVTAFAQTGGRAASVTRSGGTLTLDQAQFGDLGAGQTETLTFTYDVTDGTATVVQTLTVTVTGANDAPSVAATLTAGASEDAAPLSVDLLDGATDPDAGAALSVAGLTQTGGRAASVTESGGTLTLNPAQFTDLAAGQTETLTFSYGVTDGTATTPQTLTITVTGANDAPAVATPLTATADEDTAALTVDLLQGATDADAGAVLSVTGVTQTAGRTATVTQSGGTLTLDPAQFTDLAAGQTATLTFGYGVSDGTATTPQTLTVTVTGANDAPVLTVPGARTVNEDTDLPLTGLSIADVDAGSAPLRLTLSVGHGKVTLGSTTGLTVTAGANGTGTLTVEGTLADLNAALATARYRGASNYNGADTLQVSADDLGNGTPTAALTDTRTVAITVTPVNDAPVAAADSFTTPYQTPILIPSATLLANDSDVENDTVAFTGLGSATHGTATLDARGNVLFTPDVGFSGAATFQYTVSDGHGGTAAGTATVTVAGHSPSGPLTSLGAKTQTAVAGGLPSEWLAVAILADGSSVVAWSTAIMHMGSDLMARRYDSQGNPLGGAFMVNTTTAHDQGRPSIAALTDGGFVVTWEGRLANLGPMEIYQQRYDASGVKVGTETRVNTFTDYDQEYATTTALADGGWVVTWTSYNQVAGGGAEIYQQRYAASGTAVGGEVRVNATTAAQQDTSQVTALAGGGWVVTWQSTGQDGSGLGIYQQRYAADGTAVGGETRVNTGTAGDQHYQSVAALADGGWTVVWQSAGQDGSGTGIYAQLYNADGSTRGGERQLNQQTFGDQYRPAVTGLADGGFMVSWGTQSSTGTGWAIHGQRFHADGSAVEGEFRVSQSVDPDAGYPEVAARSDGGFLAAWIRPDANTASTSDYELATRIFDASLVSPVVSAHSGVVALGKTTAAAALVDPAHVQGDTWTSAGLPQYTAFEFQDLTDGSASGYFTLDGLRQATGQSVLVAQGDLGRVQWHSGAGAGADDFRVRAYDGRQWSDWSTGRMTTQLVGTSTTAQSLTSVAGALPGEWVSVAVLADGSSVVAWSSAHLYAGADLKARRYDAQGNPIGSTFTVNATTPYDQGRPSIAALTDGGFVVTWEGRLSNLGPMDIFQQRYDANGVKVGTENRVNTTTADNQQYAASTALADGGWVVTWTSYNQVAGGGAEIYQQRYAANGTAVGGEVRVNATTAAQQDTSQVTALAGGGWVVTWQSTGQDGSGLGIYQQRYAADGTAAGGETRVNTYTASDQHYQSVAALAGGGWAVVWQSYGQDGSGSGVYAQLYNADGSTSGVERRLNYTTNSDQYRPTVTGMADGGFMVNYGTRSGWGWAIYGRRFTADGTAVGDEFQVTDGPAADAGYPEVVARPDGGVLSAWLRPDASTSSTSDYELVMRTYTANDSRPNVYIGTSGNDLLLGSPGADTLTGGAGADAFRFNTPATGGDTITDFTTGQDRIEVVGPNFGGILAGTLSASNFALNNPADGNDWFVFNTTTRVLSFDADGSGTGAAVAIATLNVTTLSATDITVLASSG